MIHLSLSLIAFQGDMVEDDVGGGCGKKAKRENNSFHGSHDLNMSIELCDRL